MGVNLLHIRFKVAIDNAEQQFHAIDEELGETAFLLSAEGDTVHYLVPNFFGAAHLLHKLSAPLGQSMIEDYCAVGIQAIDHVVPAYDAYDASFVIAGYDFDEADDDADGIDVTPLELAHWWGQIPRAPYRRGPGFHRRGLLILTKGERRENSRVVEKIRRALGQDCAAQWHGRESILFTFWDSGYGATVQSGRLGRAVDHDEIAGAYLFDLTRDFAAMHDKLSTMATWFVREATYAPPRPRQEKEKPARDSDFGLAVRGPRRPFEVATKKLPGRDRKPT